MANGIHIFQRSVDDTSWHWLGRTKSLSADGYYPGDKEKHSFLFDLEKETPALPAEALSLKFVWPTGVSIEIDGRICRGVDHPLRHRFVWTDHPQWQWPGKFNG